MLRPQAYKDLIKTSYWWEKKEKKPINYFYRYRMRDFLLDGFLTRTTHIGESTPEVLVKTKSHER
jgi:hypothetical protein